MHSISCRYFSITTIFLLVFLSGCATIYSIPHVARSGDTITLALGSPDGLDKNTTVVMYYSDSAPSSPIDISAGVRELFKMYPDQTSYAWLESDAFIVGPRGGHGPWTSVMVIDLPLGLPLGTGHIEIISNPGAVYPRFATRPDSINIALEILEGTGTPNTFDYATFSGATETGRLQRLTGRPQVVVKPPVLPEGEGYLVSYGAVEMVLNIPITSTDGSPVIDDGIAVVLDPQPDNIFSQTQMFWSRNNNDFKISLISPIGLYQHQVRISVVPLLPNYPYEISGTPTLTSIDYYDLNGAITAGNIPAVVIEN
jgi:hypothetical protein